MIVKWSPHAEGLLDDLLMKIADTLYVEDAFRWEDKLRNAADNLGSFPLSCPTIPPECFHTVPSNPERLHQLVVRPYRIVYEVVDEECRILSIRHGRMLVTIDDTNWH